MRNWTIGIAALLLASCSGGETYPQPLDQTYNRLTQVGTPSGLYPLPGVLSQVEVTFQMLPDQSAVQWLVTHDGDDIGRFIATARADGAEASRVTVDYVDGDAPGEKWHNRQVREQLKSSIRELVVEAIDSTLENREFDKALHDRIETQVTTATIGSVMVDVRNRVMEDDPQAAEESARRLEEKVMREHGISQADLDRLHSKNSH